MLNKRSQGFRNQFDVWIKVVPNAPVTVPNAPDAPVRNLVFLSLIWFGLHSCHQC